MGYISIGDMHKHCGGCNGALSLRVCWLTWIPYIIPRTIGFLGSVAQISWVLHQLLFHKCSNKQDGSHASLYSNVMLKFT